MQLSRDFLAFLLFSEEYPNVSNSCDREIFQSPPTIAKSDVFWHFWSSWNTIFSKKLGSSLFGPYTQAKVSIKLSYFTFSTVKFPDLSLKIVSSIISIATFLLKKIATPLACEVKLEKLALPPHSALTRGSISADKRVSEIKTTLGFFFLKALRILALLGFFPIEFGLKDRILIFEADTVLFLTKFSFWCF